ncbi:MAG: hypothetical protein JNK18_12845 [Cyclobacteriaceae bacterium]|nr:hypothetical protein [Cyclobacteriaceae bacterium]
MTQLPESISRWVKDREIILEIIFAALVVLAVAMKFSNIQRSEDALMLAMLVLASFYFLTAFIQRQEGNVLIIVSQVFQIASSVSVIGLLFTIMRLPGAKEQLLIGLASMALSGVMMIFLAVTGRAQKFLPVLIRLLVLGGLSLNVWLGLWTPSTR